MKRLLNSTKLKKKFFSDAAWQKPCHNQSQKTNWEHLFTHHIIVEELISLIYKEFLQINEKKTITV